MTAKKTHFLDELESESEFDEDIRVNFFEFEEKRESLFSKFFKLFKKKEVAITNVSTNNCNDEFSEFLDEIKEGELQYNDVVEVTILCSESLDIVKRKLNFLDRLKQNEKYIEEVSAFDHIDEEDFNILKKLCERYENLKRDNTSLMYQVTSYSGTVSGLQGLEKRAEDAIPEIKKAEEKHKILEQDIAIIESERQSLYYQFDLMSNALKLTKSFSYGMIFMTIIFAFGFAYMQAFKNTNVFYPLLIMVVILMIFITFVYIFRVKTTRELKINNIKQGKLISLQNKKTAVLANTKNFLNYSYKKYNARSSKELEENLSEYTKLKWAQSRKNSAKRALNETEEEIKDFFKKHKIFMPDAPIEKLYSILEVKDRRTQCENFKNEQVRIENELQLLDDRQNDIWKIVNELKENDMTPNKLIIEIVKTYHSKAEKILNYR
ncbi:MAG: hypothetical protein ACK5LY_00870 [Lachnospirales bacterium]